MASQEPQTRHVLGQTAVVVGAGMIGLLTARVLSDFFERVVILDKDDLEEERGPLYPARKYAPQGHHLHILLSGGARVMCDLFPGIDQDFLRAGAQQIYFPRDIRWFISNRWFPRHRGELRTFIQTRPLLEAVIRRRVMGLPNVSLQPSTRVIDYRLSEEGRKVTGVSTVGSDGVRRVIESDFAVDAGGHGALLTQWLERHSFGPVRETSMGIDLAYATTFFDLPPNPDRNWKMMACHPEAPQQKIGGVICQVENGHWHVTLAGYHKDHAPTDLEGFKAYAARLPVPDLYEQIRDLTPIAPIRSYKFPASLRRHFDELKTLPEGMIGIGDVIGSLNPAFGQGMSNGALQVAGLHHLLHARAEHGRGLDGLAHPFYAQATQAIDPAWNMAGSENLRDPLTTGRRPWHFALSQWYSNRLLKSPDVHVVEQFFRVMHLVDPPSSLMTPDMIRRTLGLGTISLKPVPLPETGAHH